MLCRTQKAIIMHNLINSDKNLILSTVASADNSDLNEAVTGLCLKEDISSYITRLCKDLLYLLEFDAVKEPMGTGRTTVIEKCCIFYSRLLDIKYEGNCTVIHLVLHYTRDLF